MRAILPLQSGVDPVINYHGGSPWRKFKVDSEAPKTIKPVGTDAPPAVSIPRRNGSTSKRCDIQDPLEGWHPIWRIGHVDSRNIGYEKCFQCRNESNQ